MIRKPKGLVGRYRNRGPHDNKGYSFSARRCGQGADERVCVHAGGQHRLQIDSSVDRIRTAEVGQISPSKLVEEGILLTKLEEDANDKQPSGRKSHPSGHVRPLLRRADSSAHAARGDRAAFGCPHVNRV